MTYQVAEGEYSVMVFSNPRKDQNPKAPSHNIVIKLSDGTEIRGGLWPYQSEKAGKFLSGTARPDDGNWKRGAKPKSQAEDNAVEIDF